MNAQTGFTNVRSAARDTKCAKAVTPLRRHAFAVLSRVHFVEVEVEVEVER